MGAGDGEDLSSGPDLAQETLLPFTRVGSEMPGSSGVCLGCFAPHLKAIKTITSPLGT